MVIKKVLIDLSGTIHIENEAIPGAIQALKCLRKEKIDIKFVTNTTECRRLRYDRLVQMGFDIDISDMWTSLWATRDVIQTQKLNPMLFVAESAREDLTDLLTISNEKPKDSVVIGLAPDLFNYDSLTDAFRLLITGGKLIAIHESRYFQTSKGLALGPGLFVKGLEYAANCKAEVVGKPTAAFFKTALGDTIPEEAAMIGDDAKDDIEGAQAIGIKGYLVQTGKYQPGDENTISPSPFCLAKDFSDAVSSIIEYNKK